MSLQEQADAQMRDPEEATLEQQIEQEMAGVDEMFDEGTVSDTQEEAVEQIPASDDESTVESDDQPAFDEWTTESARTYGVDPEQFETQEELQSAIDAAAHEAYQRFQYQQPQQQPQQGQYYQQQPQGQQQQQPDPQPEVEPFKFDEELFDEPVLEQLNGMQEYYQNALRKQEEQMRMQQEYLQQMQYQQQMEAQRQAQVRYQQELQEFDDTINALANEGYEQLGVGPTGSMVQHTPQWQARNMVYQNAAHLMREAYSRNESPKLSTIVRQAARLSFPQQYEAQVQEQATQQATDAVSRRQSQFIAKPKNSGSKTKTREEAALAKMAEFYQKNGVPFDPGTDEADFEF